MGDFRIEITAVGGHGCDRAAKEGEPLSPGRAWPDSHDPEACPDCLAADFVAKLQRVASVNSATYTHWPSSTPIVDDLLTRKRAKGSFG